MDFKFLVLNGNIENYMLVMDGYLQYTFHTGTVADYVKDNNITDYQLLSADEFYKQQDMIIKNGD